MESKQGERVIVLVDMDCFYVQVEQKLCPQYQNRPCAVVQYNTWKGGGVIAVNYEARAQGVSRRGRGEDAQKVCPDIHLFRVPEVRGKADLTRYREAGASVMEVLCKFSSCVERASIDEAYIDLTSMVNSRLQNSSPVTINQIPNTFVIGYETETEQKDALQDWLQLIYEEDHLYQDRMLVEAAVIVEEMRAAVYSETGYRCSAGIAHNKMLAKLSCGIHKPNKQTVLPESSIPVLFNTIPVNKVRNLGGKFGEQVVEKFNAKTMGELMKLTKSQFVNAFGDKNGSWLYSLSRGIENEPVIPRQLPKSIGCGKNFPGKSSLNTKEKVLHWVKQLSSELEERLLKDQENNSRVARLLTVSVRNQMTAGFSLVSKSCPIIVYNAAKLAHDAYTTIQKFNTSASSSLDWTPPILSLAMSAGKFEDKIDYSMCDIQTYFAKSPIKKNGGIPSTSSSNIDTVLQLIEAEPGLSNCVTGENSNTALDEKVLQLNPRVSLGNSNEVSRDISSFFNIKDTETSEVELVNLNDKSGNNFTDHSLQTSNSNAEISSPIKECHEPNELTSTNLHKGNGAANVLNSINVTIGKGEPSQKVKGFFARKLEEKCKSMNEKAVATTSSSVAETLLNRFEVQSTSVVNSDPMSVMSSSHQNDLETFRETVVSLNPQNHYPELDPELTSLCTKCNQRIPIWEEEEHSDYHLALALSKESTKVPVVNQAGSSINMQAHNSARNATKSSKTNRKRGKNSKSAADAKKPIQQNTIDSFFR